MDAKTMTTKQKMDVVSKVIKFWNQYEGRDKSTKVAQYSLRLASALISVRNPELNKRLRNLYTGLRHARKFFRLGKGINDYQKLGKIWANKQLDPMMKAMLLFGRVCLFIYITADNFYILSHTGVVHWNTRRLNMTAGWAQALGCLVNILEFYNEALKGMKEEEELLKQDDEKQKDAQKRIAEIRSARRTHYMNCIKNFCDFVVAVNQSEFLKRTYGIAIPEAVLGTVGIIAGCISCHQLWPSD